MSVTPETQVDLHGLTHDQLVFIGLAESRAVDLLRDANGNALEAALAIKPPADAFVEANPIAAAGNNLLRAMTYDLLIDPKAQAVERLTARAKAELEAEQADSDFRTGHTVERVEEMLTWWPEDTDVEQAVRDVKEIISDRSNGKLNDEQTLEALYTRLYETDGSVSEEASTLYHQAAFLAFGFEADIPVPVDQRIHAAVRERYRHED